MAHARRKFEAIKDSSPEAQKVLYYIAVLYMLEANLKARKATHDEIRAERQEKAVPILAVLRKLLEKYNLLYKILDQTYQKHQKKLLIN